MLCVWGDGGKGGTAAYWFALFYVIRRGSGQQGKVAGNTVYLRTNTLFRKYLLKYLEMIVKVYYICETAQKTQKSQFLHN